ncbi:hypothetical protein C8035_v006874 [Colletotrichum spinosum]|uniref:Uncharacterized protein n=1 Tax=Colletotrichum spinosum TaxID=1347390 RepID=A0A4V3HT91_9PEZI|nr:hypothetical protein C8035_v006874 [Colletotrichum spinosum]
MAFHTIPILIALLSALSFVQPSRAADRALVTVDAYNKSSLNPSVTNNGPLHLSPSSSKRELLEESEELSDAELDNTSPHQKRNSSRLQSRQARRRPAIYNEIDEDTKCHEHDGPNAHGGSDIFHYNSYGSVCAGSNRQITCRPYTPAYAQFYPTLQSTIPCQTGYVCRQNGFRQTRFGDSKPYTTCVFNSALKTWVVGGREIGEKCCQKFKIPSAGGGKTVRFHEWAVNAATGIYKQVEKMYVKVNMAYYKSISGPVSDWTGDVGGIKATDDLELCAYPLTGDELKMSAQFTIL